jgi:hypothetical protein
MPKAAVRAPTLGTLIDQASEIREQKRELERQIKQKNEALDELEQQIIEALDKQGVTSSTGRRATGSITESVVPNVKDWDAFYAYIFKNKYGHLLDRRPSVTGCRELFETKGKIPGVEPFTKRKLSLTNIGS